MKPALVFRASHCAAAALLFAATLRADAMTLASLEQALRSDPVHSVPFEEVRESRWLEQPQISRGTMILDSGRIEKRVIVPRAATWRILEDRVVWIGVEGAKSRELLFSAAPALGVLAGALRRVVAGELTALESDFQIDLSGDERRWTMRLRPRDPAVARVLESIDLQGAESRLLTIVVLERPGDRTVTRLLHAGPNRDVRP